MFFVFLPGGISKEWRHIVLSNCYFEGETGPIVPMFTGLSGNTWQTAKIAHESHDVRRHLRPFSDFIQNLMGFTLQSCSNEADFKEEYIGLRRFVMELDVDRTAGDLAQCHLPNGKVLWLCPEHRMDDRISVVGGDMATQGLDRESAETLAESHGE